MVKEEIRPKLERFQAEAAKVLWEAFQEGRLTTELNLDELYRKFGITSYKQLPARRFQEAIDWLGEWHQSLTGDIPF